MAKRRKASKAAIFAVIVSLLCAAVLVLGILSEWFTHFWIWNKTPGTNAPTQLEQPYAPDAGLMLNQTSSDGIMLMSAAMPLSDFEVYDVDPHAEAVKTITARFTPADTTLKQVDYSAAWKNAGSTWANGKNVNQYLTLQQSSDGSLDCALTLLQPIGEQIVITCTARPLEDGDWVPSATYTVDYYQRFMSVVLGFGGSTDDGETSEQDYSIEISDGVTVYYEDLYSSDKWGYGWDCSNGVTIKTPQRGIGTIGEDWINSSFNVKVTISDTVAASIKSAAGISTIGSYTLAANGETDGFKLKTAIQQMLGGESNVESHRNAIYNAFKAAYDARTPALKFEFDFEANQSGFTYNFTYNVLLNPLALGVKATGLDFGGDTGVILSCKV